MSLALSVSVKSSAAGMLRSLVTISAFSATSTGEISLALTL